jgi:hypothetical protein
MAAVQSIEDLIALAGEGDEDAQAEIKKRFDAMSQGEASAKRDLTLKTDAKLRERYPRALRAWELGKVKLDGLSDEALTDALREKEDEYAQMGVPIETSAAVQVSAVAASEGGVGDVPVVDPAAALSGGRAASSPGGNPRDYAAEFFDAMKGSTEHDQARAFALLPELNRTPQGKEKIAQITQQLQSRPIIPKGM